MKNDILIEESKEFKHLKKRLVPPKGGYSVGHTVIIGQGSNWVREQFKKHESRNKWFKDRYSLGKWPEGGIMSSPIDSIVYFIDTNIVAMERKEADKLKTFLKNNFVLEDATTDEKEG